MTQDISNVFKVSLSPQRGSVQRLEGDLIGRPRDKNVEFKMDDQLWCHSGPWNSKTSLIISKLGFISRHRRRASQLETWISQSRVWSKAEADTQQVIKSWAILRHFRAQRFLGNDEYIRPGRECSLTRLHCRLQMWPLLVSTWIQLLQSDFINSRIWS